MGCCTSVVPDPPSEQEILDNLEASEVRLWRIAFAKIDCDGRGKVDLTAELLRPYIIEASALEEGDIDQVLQRQAKDGKLLFDGFVELLRKNASDDTQALAVFQSLPTAVGGEDRVESPDARNALRLYGERRCGARGSQALEEDVWEKVLNLVMKDVELMVDMEAWVAQCSILARYIRALKQQRIPIL
mmetsp:Transcript_76249/g.176953  ORF Transcript_76249/g.176953 Transcript_76249/m.176953 type:complete len:188 (+) Transcript_76249:74-637(+)